jgi:hypothetical protein
MTISPISTMATGDCRVIPRRSIVDMMWKISLGPWPRLVERQNGLDLVCRLARESACKDYICAITPTSIQEEVSGNGFCAQSY